MVTDTSQNTEASLSLPKHIAIIMDGNGRWAKKRFMPRFVGHERGLSAVKRTVRSAIELDIEALTLFAFSTENWKRPPEEVNKLMSLFMVALQREVKKLHENNVRLRIIGDTTAFNDEIQQKITDAETLTQSNTGLALNIAANYGGRLDIVNAVKKWANSHPELSIDDLDEEAISRNVFLEDLPLPDLLIRTGGEQRISNFLLWQMAYAEFYFTDELWPDFDKTSLKTAIESFQNRERRFGKTSEQVQKKC